MEVNNDFFHGSHSPPTTNKKAQQVCLPESHGEVWQTILLFIFFWGGQLGLILMGQTYLAGGFSPVEKYQSRWESSPIGVKIKNIRNHHLDTVVSFREFLLHPKNTSPFHVLSASNIWARDFVEHPEPTYPVSLFQDPQVP